MERPVIEFSSRINQLTFQIDAIEKRLYRYRTVIESFDTRLRETVGLAAEVAGYQLEMIEELLNVPPQQRDYTLLYPTFRQKLRQLKADYLKDYDSLLKAREGYFSEGKIIPFTEEKREELKANFALRLDEELQHYEQEFHLSETTSFENLKQELEEKIAIRREVYDILFEEKSQLSMQEQDQQELLGPEYQKCLAERETLKKELEVQDLYSASQLGNTDYIRTHLQSLWFFQKKKSLNKLDTRGFAPLHYAAYHGRLEAVRLFLNQEADPTVRDRYGYQPLHRAAQNGQSAIIEELLTRKAPITARGEYGRTPLHMSVFNGKIAATLLLLGKNAPINAQTDPNDRKSTPLHDAVAKGHLQMVAVLAQRESLYVLTENGARMTPLHEALENGLVEIARLLLRHPSFKREAFTPLAVSQVRRECDAVQALLQEFGLSLSQ